MTNESAFTVCLVMAMGSPDFGGRVGSLVRGGSGRGSTHGSGKPEGASLLAQRQTRVGQLVGGQLGRLLSDKDRGDDPATACHLLGSSPLLEGSLDAGRF